MALLPQSAGKLSFLALSGPDKDDVSLEAAIAECEGLILALDSDWTLTAKQLEVFIPSDQDTKLKHVCLMSRNLNGQGMGLFVGASKRGANEDVPTWSSNRLPSDYH